MKKRSDPPSGESHGPYDVGDLLGLGSQSARKSYYPALQERLEELERERNRYKWLFENALHGIFRGDLRGGFLDLNPAMAHICGYESPEALRTRVWRLREQLFWRASDFDHMRHELLADGQLSTWECLLRRADGEPVPVAVTVLRRPDLGAEVVEAFVADVTDRYQARRRLEQLNAELERRVDERTEALQNANVDLRYQIEERKKIEQQLVVAVEAAKEANRSKDKYLAAASHDLMQPLNAARLLISTLQDSPLPQRESRLVMQVHRAMESAEDLLADLLDISKLDQQAMTPDLVDVDARGLVMGLAGEFQPIAEDAGLLFRQRLMPATVRTDPRMLTRILRNLLSNAFRYTREGRILLAMRHRGASLRIEIWDTGVGIAEDKLREIFTEFHQLEGSQMGGRQGVGLGLAIVDRMARMLGCEVDVDSRPGRGSRFALIMPLAQSLEPATRLSHGLAALPADTVEGCHVLVIDNEPAVLESMGALLSRWGCEVELAGSGELALERCLTGAWQPQVILADYHLDNNRTGVDAIFQIRRALGRDIPAAIITADRTDESRQALQSEYMPVLGKPVKPNRLRALLASLTSDNRPLSA